MELEDELATEDLELAARLFGLRRNPSTEARARIIAAVRSAAGPAITVPHRPAWRRRTATMAMGVTAVLAGSSVAAFAATADATPGSPAYAVRVAGEDLRLAVADPRGKEYLRSQFAQGRLRQFGRPGAGGHEAGLTLLRDAKTYLEQAAKGIKTVSGDEREQIDAEIHNLQREEQRDEGQINEGDSGQSSHPGSSQPVGAPSAGPQSRPATNSSDGGSNSSGQAGQDGTSPGSNP